jgi:hypothetical protein
MARLLLQLNNPIQRANKMDAITEMRQSFSLGL